MTLSMQKLLVFFVVAGQNQKAAKLYPMIRDFVQSGISLIEVNPLSLHERCAGMATAAGEARALSDEMGMGGLIARIDALLR